jgi:hypothetical protein
MSEGHTLGRDPANYREVADRLRTLARQVRFDTGRVKPKLHALADGFDRLADRLEREMTRTRFP